LEKIAVKLPARNTAAPESSCSFCYDSGYTDSHYCTCRRGLAERRNVYGRRLSGTGVPARALGYSLLRIERPRAKFISNYINSNLDSVILYGDIGTGKTVMAVGILKALMWRYGLNPWGNVYQAIFITVPEFFRNLELTYKENLSDGAKERVKGYVDLFHRAVDADLLILDDIGKEKMSAARAQDLYTLINARYNHLRTTVVTLNAVAEDVLAEIERHIGGQHGEAISSRLAEMAPVKNRCRLRGKDRRL